MAAVRDSIGLYKVIVTHALLPCVEQHCIASLAVIISAVHIGLHINTVMSAS